MLAAVRDLNRLELVGESVRACLEALAVAAPGWLAATLDVSGCGMRYGRGQPAPPRQAAWLPNLITGVATTDATVPDQSMTEPTTGSLPDAVCSRVNAMWTPAARQPS